MLRFPVQSTESVDNEPKLILIWSASSPQQSAKSPQDGHIWLTLVNACQRNPVQEIRGLRAISVVLWDLRSGRRK
jgi:hypothetical protein